MSIWDALAAGTADLSIMASDRRDPKPNTPLDEALPFTVGMISLAAKMAKADGVASPRTRLSLSKRRSMYLIPR
jgi:hypothetical protein